VSVRGYGVSGEVGFRIHEEGVKGEGTVFAVFVAPTFIHVVAPRPKPYLNP